MEILLGAVGAMIMMAMAAGGCAIGWWARGKFESGKSRTGVTELTEDELRRKKAEEKAMEAVMSYSADTAYGTKPDNRGDRS